MEQTIRVSVEIHEGPVSRRVRITAPSIRQTLALAGDGKPGKRVRLISPIEPERFFVSGGAPRETPRFA